MNTTAVRRLAAAGLALAAVALAVPVGSAQAQATSTAPSSAADAYGLDVDVSLLPVNIPINEGPFARATQEFPPLAAEPAEAELLGAGPIPAGGELVQNIGVLQSLAGANGAPLAVASSQAVDVALLSQGGAPMISADIIRAQSSTDCTSPPSSAGTEFVNLTVAGSTDPIPEPPPNTELAPQLFNPLGLKVILNEQHPTADGRGLVVNAIHIYNFSPPTIPGIFVGDIIVAHAMSTVNCPNGAGSTGPPDSDIFITKEADKAQVAPGGTVTYTANVKNNSDAACLVNRFTDHAPAPFELVSTSGAFGTVAEVELRPGGGQDIVIKPEALTIAPGATATQTFVLKVKDDAAPGVYFNNVEILCANLGNWVKGLDAPVEVTGIAPPAPLPDPEPRPEPLPRTGSSRDLQVLAGIGLLGAALLIRRKAITI